MEQQSPHRSDVNCFMNADFLISGHSLRTSKNMALFSKSMESVLVKRETWLNDCQLRHCMELRWYKNYIGTGRAMVKCRPANNRIQGPTNR